MSDDTCKLYDRGPSGEVIGWALNPTSLLCGCIRCKGEGRGLVALTSNEIDAAVESIAYDFDPDPETFPGVDRPIPPLRGPARQARPFPVSSQKARIERTMDGEVIYGESFYPKPDPDPEAA